MEKCGQNQAMQSLVVHNEASVSASEAEFTVSIYDDEHFFFLDTCFFY